jgi:hypothetical protein
MHLTVIGERTRGGYNWLRTALIGARTSVLTVLNLRLFAVGQLTPSSRVLEKLAGRQPVKTANYIIFVSAEYVQEF